MVVRAATNDADLDRVICRKGQATGSRLRAAEVCKTKREWDKVREEAARGVNNMENQRGIADTSRMGGG